MLKTHVENTWGLNSLNIKRTQTLSSTILLHNNRGKDGSTTTVKLQGKYLGNYYNSSNFKQPSLRDLILEQARINESISKKLAFNDKVLENINTKMDSFSSAIQDQLSYNKKIESQLA